MAKVDFKKEAKQLYAPPRDPVEVDVPEMAFLAIDGEGAPESQDFMDAIQALYSASYTLKFMLKADGFDYTVMPLEGLWWADDPAAFRSSDKPAWKWTAMIRQPDRVTPALVEEAVVQASAKRRLAAASKIRLERLDESRCVQIMHVGPYEAEEPTIDKLHAFIAENGWKLRGKHHEIYLSDPHRTAPEKMKTAIRQPVAEV